METMNTQLEIKGGWFLIGTVHIRGCTHYSQSDVQKAINPEDGTSVATWKGMAYCDSVDEAKSVCTTRAKALAIIAKACSKTRLGYFCPWNKKEQLEESLKSLDKLVADYNEKAQFTELWSDVGALEVASKDVMVARAVWQEATDVLKELQAALQEANADDIKKVLKKVRQIGGVLPELQETALTDIVKQSKVVAKKLKKQANVLDEATTEELIQDAYAPVRACRLLFSERLREVPKETTISRSAPNTTTE